MVNERNADRVTPKSRSFFLVDKLIWKVYDIRMVRFRKTAFPPLRIVAKLIRRGKTRFLFGLEPI